MSSTEHRRLHRDLAVMLEERDRIALEDLGHPRTSLLGERCAAIRMLLIPTSAMPLGDLDTASQLVRWDHRPDMPATYAASEFAAFLDCPWIHHHRYRSGISTTTVHTRKTLEPLSASARGTVLHDFLRFFHSSWDDARQIHEMSLSLRNYARGRALYPTDSEIERAAADLVAETFAYRQSGWSERVEGATHTRREADFVFSFDSNTSITGTFDVIMQESDGWRVLDYKTAATATHRDGGGVDRGSWRYEVQAAVYALAVETMYGRGTMREFVFLFTASGQEIRIPVTSGWLESWRIRLAELIRRMRRAEYVEPVREEKCSGCEFLRLCHPADAG